MILRSILEEDSEIEVIGEAADGREAVEKALRYEPDIITMDIHMPELSGLEAVKRIMEKRPMPILIVTGVEGEGDGEGGGIFFQALQYGALEVVEKPKIRKGERYEHIKKDLVRKIKVLAREKNFFALSRVGSPRLLRPHFYRVVAMGASTGGPRVLQEILGSLPSDYPLGILLVQHITSSFIKSFVQWLDRQVSLKVSLAEHGQSLEPSVVLVAPADRHLIVRNQKVLLEGREPLNGCLPSVDMLFNSVALEYGRRAVGVLLTGMGSDGAKGLKMIYDRGGHTIVQSEESCVVFGMPKEAMDLGAARKILSPKAIARELVECLGRSYRER